MAYPFDPEKKPENPPETLELDLSALIFGTEFGHVGWDELSDSDKLHFLTLQDEMLAGDVGRCSYLYAWPDDHAYIPPALVAVKEGQSGHEYAYFNIAYAVFTSMIRYFSETYGTQPFWHTAEAAEDLFEYLRKETADVVDGLSANYSCDEASMNIVRVESRRFFAEINKLFNSLVLTMSGELLDPTFPKAIQYGVDAAEHVFLRSIGSLELIDEPEACKVPTHLPFWPGHRLNNPWPGSDRPECYQ